MATARVAHHPELTPERAMQVFRGHFSPKYQVYEARFPLDLLRIDFVVKKYAWTGTGVKLEQDSGSTTFVFTALMPNFILQLLIGGLIGWIFLRPSWKALEDEVRAFIESAEDFK